MPVDTILTYCRYNLMISDMEDRLIPFAEQHGVGVINASTLHMGILTARGAPDWHPAPSEVREAGQRVIEFCRDHGVDGAELALQFCFEYPNVASTLVGMSTVHHVEQNPKALRLRYDPELLGEIQKIVAPVYNYRWTSGRAENHG